VVLLPSEAAENTLSSLTNRFSFLALLSLRPANLPRSAFFRPSPPDFPFSSFLPLSDLSRQKAAYGKFRRNLLSNMNRIFPRNDTRRQSAQFGDLRSSSNFSECSRTFQYFGESGQ
jgi:hypothetical protein